MPSVRPLPANHPIQVERRRRRRGRLDRLIAGRVGDGRPGKRAGRLLPLLWRRGWPVLAALAVIALGAFVWESRVPVLSPRHRAEALCFALARARFSPPMAVEPSAAVVRGRFSEQTPASVAVRETMHFTDDMVMQETTRRAGDYPIDVAWLRLPGQSGHWLVVAWMEGADLEVCSFRFAGPETDLTADEKAWGERLLAQILTGDNFQTGQVPAVRLRGALPRSFGPKT